MTHRIALGVSYNGSPYHGWQSQSCGNTVQDQLEAALTKFATQPISTLCAGRTDSGVHGLMQVVHFDTAIERTPASWVRGTNAFLPSPIAVQWAQAVPPEFHARASATARRYAYVVLQSPVRPSVEAGRVGWVHRPIDGDAIRAAAALLLGEHDFSSFRAAACQALSPVKTIHRFRPTACIFKARCTTRNGVCRRAPLRMIGCHEHHCPHAINALAPHPHQSLRPDARARCGRRRGRWRRCHRLGAVCTQPAGR